MKVLHVLNSDKFSGAENVVCQIIDMFRGNTEIEMAYCSPDGPIAKVLNEKGIDYFPLISLTKKELKKAIEKFQPDIIHAHDMRASYIASKVCHNVILVSHIHNNAFDARKISLKTVAYYFAAKKAEHIFWVSRDALSGYKFRKSIEKKSSVLYNVIDDKALYEKCDTDNNVYDYDIVFVGRMTYAKNVHKFLDVCKSVAKENPNLKVAIVGDGELMDNVKMYCNKLDLNNNVEFLGFRSNPLKIVHDARCFVMTSRWEGLPMCVLEALALGTPVVSTPVGGIKEIIVDGANGFLRDEDGVMAQCIADVITNEALRKQLKENCVKSFAEINDIEHYKNELLNCYTRACCK